MTRVLLRSSLALVAAFLVGCSSTSDPALLDGGITGFDASLRQYGTGETAVLLSGTEAPSPFCWFIEETIRICGGNGSPTQDRFVLDICYDETTDCLSLQPENSERESGSCWLSTSYELAGQGPLYGTCVQVDEYMRGDPKTQCLMHSQCPAGRRCVDYQCLCPSGAQCACFSCPPPAPARCEGDTVVRDDPLPECDANDRCQYETRRIDCQAAGGRCDPSRAQCVDVSARDAGPSPDASPSPDAGSIEPDAGCNCPPSLPPSCEDNVRVERHCDSNCSIEIITEDCAAQGLICDPDSVTCVLGGECQLPTDCPPPDPAPPGQCTAVSCENQDCVYVTGPC